ncbi:MAG: hypothetical protein SV377_03465 [Halobacteria archaeon]|nr:hypothetical protein [Halobacteria archaeon]
MSVTLPEDLLHMYDRFTLYNSPYIAHRKGHAIDLYPSSNTAPSPVRGEVTELMSVKAPTKSYAVDEDYLILIDTGEYVARILHVDPNVGEGDYVEVGDRLGEMVRSGFFARWVSNHIHLGLRGKESNLYRASGSMRLNIDLEILPLNWDGTGEVVDTGETFAVLDKPGHPSPNQQFVGIRVGDGSGGVIDGGVPHYAGGGILGSNDYKDERERLVYLAGTPVGTGYGRDVTWNDIDVFANGTRITGVSLFVAKDDFGAKLICPQTTFEEGDHVEVTIARS